MTPLDSFLSKLTSVKQTAHGKYQACCPAHEDKSPSLSIVEGDKGQVVFNCFAGCEKLEILDSLGLNWADLYPRDSTFVGSGKGIQTGRPPLPGWARPAARERLQDILRTMFLLYAEALPEGSSERNQAASLMAEASELLSDGEKKKKNIELLTDEQLDEELGLSSTSKPRMG